MVKERENAERLGLSEDGSEVNRLRYFVLYIQSFCSLSKMQILSFEEMKLGT